MSSFLPPSFNSALFNSNAFSGSTYITKQQADLLYLNTASGKNLYMLDVVPGTVQASRALVYNSAGSLDAIKVARNTGDCVTLNTTDVNGRCTILMTAPSNSLEIGVRSDATGSFPSTYYRYSNGSYRFVQNCTNGNSQHFGQFLVDTSGSHLTLRNGAQTSFFEETSGGILRTVSGLSMNLDANGLRIDSLGNTASSRSRLDLGDSISNKTFGIYNNGTAFYGLSANNTMLQSSSNGGFTWYSGCTDASPVNTLRMTLASNGVLTTTENVIMPKGFFVQQTGFSGAGRVGIGLACHMANASFAELFTWDYTNSLWKDMKINNTMYVNGTNSFVQIGSNPGNPLYPLSVSGNFTTSFAGSYGWLNQTGSGSGSSTGSVPVTCFLQHRLWCSEVNAFSDRRLKENIKELPEEDAIDFIRNVKPVSFNWRSDKDQKRALGYIAQSVLKHEKFPELVSLGPDPDLEEEIEIINGREFISPKGQRFNVSYQGAVPILHSALASAFDLIEEIRDELDELKKNNKK